MGTTGGLVISTLPRAATQFPGYKTRARPDCVSAAADRALAGAGPGEAMGEGAYAEVFAVK
jgi:hypothetical protein